jgi:hypothetical protein
MNCVDGHEIGLARRGLGGSGPVPGQFDSLGTNPGGGAIAASSNPDVTLVGLSTRTAKKNQKKSGAGANCPDGKV